MSLVRMAWVGTIIALCAACAPAPQRTGGKGAQPPQDIAAEVSRICALPVAEREKALEKLKQDSGMVLFCGSRE